MKIDVANQNKTTFHLQSSDRKLADHTYTIHIRVTDKAGNAAKESKITYKKDCTAPVAELEIRVNNESIANNGEVSGIISFLGDVSDGHGSQVKSSSLTLYPLTESGEVDSTAKPIPVYSQMTISNACSFDTKEHRNGQYRAVLEAEDHFGHQSKDELTFMIANKVAAPKIDKNIITKNNSAAINWRYEDNTRISRMQYSTDHGATWKNTGSGGTSGTFQAELVEEERCRDGLYEILVRAVDLTGLAGKETRLTCEIDQTAPECEILSTTNGVVKGNASDKNMTGWKIFIKKSSEADSVYQEILSGNKSPSNGQFGTIPVEGLETDTYTVKLEVSDKAGNCSTKTKGFFYAENDVIAEILTPAFRIERDGCGNDSDNHFTVRTGTDSLELDTEGISLITTINSGVKWYIDGQLKSEDDKLTEGFPTNEEIHEITAVINGRITGTPNYSMPVTKNLHSQNIRLDSPDADGVIIKQIELEGKATSFRIFYDEGTNAQVKVQIGSNTCEIESGKTYYVCNLDKNLLETDQLTLQIHAADTAHPQTPGSVVVWSDVLEKETFRMSAMENYRPEELSVIDKINYKTYIKWDIPETIEEDVYYEVYKSRDKNFKLSGGTLAADRIQAGYWCEPNFDFEEEFYYKVRAVRVDDGGKIIDKTSLSPELSAAVVDENEVLKRLGIKEYWEYAEVETPAGDAYIEESRGNFVYQQTDAILANEQLEVDFTRTYNSQASSKSAFGRGWNHNYDMEILTTDIEDDLEEGKILLKDGSGTIYEFFPKNQDACYISTMGKYVTLEKKESTDELSIPDRTVTEETSQNSKVTINSSYQIATKDNVLYKFNNGGQLVLVQEANGNFLFFEYDRNKGCLSRITTSQNISMEFVYNKAAEGDTLLVREVRFPDGSRNTYQYAGEKLVSVTRKGSGEESIVYDYGYTLGGSLKSFTDGNDKNTYQVSYQGKKVESITYPHDFLEMKESVEVEYLDGEKTKVSKCIGGKPYATETASFDGEFGNVKEILDAEGNVTTYNYKDHLRVATSYEYPYQALEDGKVVSHMTTKTETTQYDSDQNVASETDETGETTTYTYGNPDSDEILDDLPTAAVEVDGDGKTVTDETYAYDENGNLILLYDRVTDTSLYTQYDDEGEVISEKEIDGRATVNSRGELNLGDAEVENATTYTYSYDAEGNKTEKTVEITDEARTITEDRYDPLGRLLSSTVTYQNSAGTIVDRKSGINTLDSFGRIIKTENTEGVGANAIVTATAASYYPNGMKASETAEDGTVTSWTYDRMGRVVSETVQKGNLSKTWTTEYSYRDVTIQTGKGSKTIENAFVSTEKNPDGKELGETCQNALGQTVREKQNGIYADMTYDRQGNILSKYEVGIDGAASENATLEIYLYDEFGNQYTTIVNPGNDGDTYTAEERSIVTSQKYDTSGNVISETDGENNTTHYEYDALGQVTKVTLPDEAVNETTIAYDVENDDGTTSTIVTDAQGNRSETVTNELDLEVAVRTLGDGKDADIATEYEYDAADKVIQETDSAGNSRTYEYDGKDRKTAVNYYDRDGRKTMKTEFTYDLSDNITSMSDYRIEGNTATLYRYTAYEYDELKRLIGYAELGEDDLSESGVTKAKTEKNQIRYTYDIDDNLTSVTYPQRIGGSVEQLLYTWDEVTRNLEKIEVKTASGIEPLREYTYTADGKVDQIKDYRDFLTGDTATYTLRTYTYDAFDRATSITYTDSTGSDIKEKYEYTYDKNNNIKTESRYSSYEYNGTLEEEDDAGINELRTYNYDRLGRLVEVRITDCSIQEEERSVEAVTFEYDKVGNRIKETKGDVETIYTYNSLNQLTRAVETGGETGGEEETAISGNAESSNRIYTYDSNGNQIREADSVTKINRSYQYDEDNRLKSATITKDGTVIVNQKNTYNGNGQRVIKSDNGKRTEYFYDNDIVLYTVGSTDISTRLEERTVIGEGEDESEGDDDPDPAITSFNLMGTESNVIASGRNVDAPDRESYYFYNKDMKGSTTNILNREGKSERLYEYTDFGETETAFGEAFYNEICYTGGIYDESTELYYLNARYYNPEEGRFLTEDTYRGEYTEPDSMHLYAYCANNPVTYKDPSGHIPIWAIIGGAVGARDGHKYAKKRGYKGAKKTACIVGGAIVGAINPFKVGKIAKHAKRVSKLAKKAKLGRSTGKRGRKLHKISRKTKKAKIKSIRQYRKAKCKITRKGCFTAGTLIATDEGEVPIETIREGQLVWSENPETGEVALKEVVQTFVRESDEILHITTDDGEEIETTAVHVFYEEHAGFLPAGDLRVGDILHQQDGTTIRITEIETEKLAAAIPVYNFEVAEFHTYYVSDENVLVHNKCKKTNITDRKARYPNYQAKESHQEFSRKLYQRGYKVSVPKGTRQVYNFKKGNKKITLRKKSKSTGDWTAEYYKEINTNKHNKIKLRFRK